MASNASSSSMPAMYMNIRLKRGEDWVKIVLFGLVSGVACFSRRRTAPGATISSSLRQRRIFTGLSS